MPTCAGLCFFFFSSRRRHTRCGRDWSSDVCSSDLGVGDRRARPTREMGYEAAARAVAGAVAEGSVGAGAGASVGKIHGIARAMRGGIGSASVRLGEIVVGALVAVKAPSAAAEPPTRA